MGMNDRAKRNSIFTLRAFVARNTPCLGAAGMRCVLGRWIRLRRLNTEISEARRHGVVFLSFVPHRKTR